MATVGQIYYNILDTNSGGYISTYGIDIYSNIVQAFGARQFNKIGIQAPPGTKVVMNTNKTIMIGRTGVYELDDEDIVITSLYFIRPYKYVLDQGASKALINTGVLGMEKAETTKQNALADLASVFPTTPTDPSEDSYSTYWDAYNKIQSDYIASYQNALSQFNSGTQGVYVLPNSADVNAVENYEDLQNVIVDFIYE